MGALTKDRNTKEAMGSISNHPMKAAVKCFAGGIATLDAAGNCQPGATATTLTAIGRIEEQVDNSTGAAGDKTVDTRTGVFRYANSAAADEITRAEIGGDCYIVDDQTVAKTDGGTTRSIAGRIVDLDTVGVWVKLGLI